MKLSADLTELVEHILHTDLDRFGLRDVTVRAGEDHDGDPALMVSLIYDDKGEPIDPDVLLEVLTRLRDELWERGELRFPYLRHQFPESRQILRAK